MSDKIQDILDILHNCHPFEADVKNDEEDAETSVEDDFERIVKEAEGILNEQDHKGSSIEYASFNKMLALSYLKIGDEIKAICHLIESHAVIVQQQILHRYEKIGMQEEVINTPQSYGLKPLCKYGVNSITTYDSLMSVLTELPKEWYMLQVTGLHESPDRFCDRKLTHPIHITVLPTGCTGSNPLCITVSKPENSNSFDVCQVIEKLLCNNRDELQACYANTELYWKMRARQNNTLEEAMKELEYTWLREWRILFMADPIDNDELVQDLTEMLNKLISDSKNAHDISERSRWLLRKIVLAACYLTREEIARAVTYVIPDHVKLAGNIILSIYGKLSEIEELKSATRKTLILILDEHMDYIPFEFMDILKSHPATRFPSLHVAYGLFKEHETSIENGCKVIKAKDNMGTCIVNPSGSLVKMEKRIKVFIQYWLPNWRSWYSVKPEAELFEDALINDDILMYNGHGSGIQYLAGECIERLKVKSVVLLFGCSSVKLLKVGGRHPPYGVSNQYLIASSPCVLGMLWEVTDCDIDKMTASFISSWIPSTSERPWSDVDQDAWCTGTLKFSEDQDESLAKFAREPEMLRAVAKSKKVCSHSMTAAAIVVRGLPIKLV